MDVGQVAEWLLIGGGAASLAGAGVTALQSRAAKRRMDADAAKLDAETKKMLTERAGAVNAMALSLLEPMERRIHELTNEVDSLRKQVHTLNDRLTLAHHLLTQHQIPFPPWNIELGPERP